MRHAGGEIVLIVRGKIKITQPEHRRLPGAGIIHLPQWAQEQPGKPCAAHDHHQQGRIQPLESSQIKRQGIESLVLLHLGKDQAGNEVA